MELDFQILVSVFDVCGLLYLINTPSYASRLIIVDCRHLYKTPKRQFSRASRVGVVAFERRAFQYNTLTLTLLD